MRLARLALLSCLAASAQAAALTLAGRVLDAASSEPIDKAEVMLFAVEGDGVRATRTDAKGRYRFAGVQPGNYKLTANKIGWVHEQYGGGAPLAVAPGLGLSKLDFDLDRAAVVYGRITDGQSAPVAGARVLLYGPSHLGLDRRFFPGSHSETNDLGEFRIYNVAPGSYYLAAEHQDRLMRDSDVKLEGVERKDFARTFYPGVLDPKDATHLRLVPGEVRSVDLVLRLVGLFSASGVVTDSNGELPSSLELTPAADFLGLLLRREVHVEAPSGAFEIENLTPGSYLLTAKVGNAAPPRYLYEKIEVADRNVDDLRFPLRPASSVAGRVTVLGGALAAPGALRVSLSGGGYNPGNTSAPVAESGEFVISDVAPMRYRVILPYLPADAYVESVAWAGRPLQDAAIELQGGEKVEDLEIVLRLDGGRVEGVVGDREQRPLGGAIVVAIPGSASAKSPLETVVSDSLGRFTFRGLKPGAYQVLAFEKLDGDVYREPGFFDPYAGRGETAMVRNAAAVKLDLKVIQTE